MWGGFSSLAKAAQELQEQAAVAASSLAVSDPVLRRFAFDGQYVALTFARLLFRWIRRVRPACSI
jgi:hypothetical protein